MERNVSICIPVYNGAAWLRACLESACACTVAEEIIVCDDRSTDSSLSIAEEFAAQDARVIVYPNAQNLGLVGNWNRCLELAKGVWVKFLFQDDRLQAGAVEKMIAAAQPTDMLIAARRNFVFTENSSAASKKYYTEEVLTLDKLAPGETEFRPERIAALSAIHIARNFIGEPSTVLFRRSLCERIGSFDNVFKQICDLEYWLRIASTYGLRYVPEALIDFTIHDEQTSAKNAGAEQKNNDAILLVDLLLHAKYFADYRSYLSISQKRRLTLWLRVHTYELRMNYPDQAEKIFEDRPHLRTISRQAGNAFWARLVRMRRK